MSTASSGRAGDGLEVANDTGPEWIQQKERNHFIPDSTTTKPEVAIAHQRTSRKKWLTSAFLGAALATIVVGAALGGGLGSALHDCQQSRSAAS